MDKEDPDVKKLIEQLQHLEKPLPGFNHTLQAINSWDRDQRVALDILRDSGAPAAASFYKYLRDRHKEWAESRMEFIIGYEPDELSTRESARLADWEACIAEAFDLSGAKTDLDLAPEAAHDFQYRFANLVEKAARILIPLERKWKRLKE
jgi:hypothetical protein